MAVTIGAEVLYFSIGISIILFLASVYMRDAALAAVAGMILGLVGLHIILNGFDSIDNTLTESIGVILSVIGAYVFVRVLFEQMVEEVDKFGG